MFESAGHGTQGTSHPAELPQALGDWLIQPFTTAQTVLDPFAGSGVFLAAAKATGKRAVGIEKEERWCALAAERCQQARLISLTDIQRNDSKQPELLLPEGVA